MSARQDVRDFYDRVGWREVAAGVYQNARYEDLRPVSREYIRRCHLRVGRHLAGSGEFLLDAGCGPIQYPEYLAYSLGYRGRVCADLSITALQEARRKIGEHGRFVVADIARLPFKRDAFDGVVSLHTIHHLPLAEHARAYADIHRVLKIGRTAVVVNGWSRSPLMDGFRWFSRRRRTLWRWLQDRRGRLTGRSDRRSARSDPAAAQIADDEPEDPVRQSTFVEKHDPAWFNRAIAPHFETRILVWRSASVHFLKNYIFERLGGRLILRLLYRLEETFPHFFGMYGTYPLIVFSKTSPSGRQDRG